MFADVKYAIRQLKKSPGFAVTAVLTLALGIGANAVVFSVLNALVLKPLNVPHSQNLYMVQRFQYPSQSYPDYLDLRDRNKSFDSLVGYNIIGSVGVDTGGNPSTAWPYEATGNYFDALGIQPYPGRSGGGWTGRKAQQNSVHDYWGCAAGISWDGTVLCAGDVVPPGGPAGGDG
jgi:hypothetical protein